MSLDKDTNSAAVMIPTPRVILASQRQTILNVSGTKQEVLHAPVVSIPALTQEFLDADPWLHLSVYRYNRGYNNGDRVHGWRWSFPADNALQAGTGWNGGNDNIGPRRTTWKVADAGPTLDLLAGTGAQVIGDWFKEYTMEYLEDVPSEQRNKIEVHQFTGGKRRHSVGGSGIFTTSQVNIKANTPRYSAAKPLHGWFRFAFSIQDPTEDPLNERARMFGPASKEFRASVLANTNRERVFTPQEDGTVKFNGSDALLCEFR